MKLIAWLFHLSFRLVALLIVIMIISGGLFVAYRGNRPMNVPQAPKGMTYFQFMADRMDAAKTVRPAQCGWGTMLFLAFLGPVYSLVYTEVGVHPDGWIARGVASDADIPKGVENAPWYELPGIWWNVVERLSWTTLAKQPDVGCKLRPVN